MTPVGTNGVRDLGTAAAIANAVCHATGTWVRSLPISIEKVLGQQATSAGDASRLDAMARTTASAIHQPS
jgi:hypothetical protein